MGKELQVVAPTPGDTLSLTFCKSSAPAEPGDTLSLTFCKSSAPAELDHG